MSKTVHIIGSGFSSLSASCYLAKAGYTVKVLEKNANLGGRARQMKHKGFTFDMGPSWYWMPDVFERFFKDFDKTPQDYYKLDKLNPGYQVVFGKDDSFKVADNLEELYNAFEQLEDNGAQKLKKFMDKARSNYDIAIKKLVYKPGESPLELVTPESISKLGQFFGNIDKDVERNFKNPKLKQILKFPVLFLGARPQDTPSFYSFMNYADFGLGTWHPKGGMFSVVKAMQDLATSLGVTFETNANVEYIHVDEQKHVKGLTVNGEQIDSDLILSGADYHHTESLLDQNHRQYLEQYWEKKTFAPSSLLFYVGFDKKLKNINHHNLFFDVDFNQHADEIYKNPKWPEEPLFYANFTSLTDPDTAPENCENGFFLIPLAPDIKDTEALRDEYFLKIITRFEKLTNQKVQKNIIFKKSFCVSDFKKDYNSYKGNAYGMANTLLQTAFLRPRLKSNKVKGLYFTGQLTVPGPGVPPALISGKLVADLIEKYDKS
ncbi:phytoene desaturase family protein [Mesohalobacter halotolerans]|uniref:Phytoene desaturase n=1 Tax=Mesohalobacter halotolerans TaxID=1883405 RepID=A0A4U5TRJ6_9FLAO|nr:phytoene desaturase family protein [Mesohalobacter halotolerans]MBS3738719.1 phytoene desaturase [Psychroflexus sp.]TKS56726.1 phytoene desaturase [Mesohalobacter halotolerans]